MSALPNDIAARTVECGPMVLSSVRPHIHSSTAEGMTMLTRVLVFVLLCGVTVSAQQPTDYTMRVGYVALAAVTVSDIELTGRALERPGISERNPLYKPFEDKPGVLGLVNGAVSGSVGLWAYSLHKKGQRKAAKIVIWTWTVVRAFVVIHNVRQLRKE